MYVSLLVCAAVIFVLIMKACLYECECVHWSWNLQRSEKIANSCSSWQRHLLALLLLLVVQIADEKKKRERAVESQVPLECIDRSSPNRKTNGNHKPTFLYFQKLLFH